MKLSTLASIVRQVETIDKFRPKTASPAHCVRHILQMNEEDTGEFFYAIDQLCLNVKLLQNEEV